MKTASKLLAVVLLSLGLPLVHAQGRGEQPWSVNVPFNFVVQNTSFNAGHYIVQRDGFFVMIRSIDGKMATQLTVPEYSTRPSNYTGLVFLHHGETYQLSEVRDLGNSTYFQLHAPKQPKHEVEKQTGPLVAEVSISESR